jgi:23S rRNA (guanosine2251-2'-O)-methyltransferase
VIVYGRNPVREAIRGPRTVDRVWATKNAAREPWLSGTVVVSAAAEEIEQRCGSPAHQGVCAHVSEFLYADIAPLLTTTNPVIVALDQVQDPQNFGAICRTAECVGATAVVITERRSAEVTASVCKASAARA